MPHLFSSPARRVWLLAGITALGLALSWLLFRYAWQGESEKIATGFQRRAIEQARTARERLGSYDEMVHSLSYAFIDRSELTRETFQRVAQQILRRNGGVQALQFVEHVTHAERAGFEAAESVALGRPFFITEASPENRMVRAADRPEYTVIRFVEPMAGNEVVVGYDNSTSESARKLAQARAEKRLVVTQQLRLAQAPSEREEYGVIFILPVFQPSPGGNAAEFSGFVQGVFRIETMLAQPHRAHNDEALNLYYIDLDARGNEPAVLFGSIAGKELQAHDRRFVPVIPTSTTTFRETIELGGRRWMFVVTMNNAWASRQRTLTPWLILLAGIASTALTALLVHVLLRRTEEVERQVEDRTALLQKTQRELQNDIARRDQAERALQASETRLQAFLDHSPAAMFLKDLSGRYMMVNQTFETLCGRARAEIIGRTDHDLYEPSTASAFRANDENIVSSGLPNEFEEQLDTPGGPRTSIVQKFPLRDVDGRVYAIGGIATDITARMESERQVILLERQLLQSQKLESLGVLAGGIAHDFNNILTAVLGNATLARRQLAADHPVATQLEQIERAARRASDLCSQMLAYAGKGSMVIGPVSVSEIVRDTTALLEVSVPKNTRLILELAPQLPSVQGDATQLRQIVMNLVLNAADAIGDRSGQITLRTYLTEAGRGIFRAAVQSPDLAAGTYVGVEVRDTGCGMTPETLARIFEPFFTTKFSGRGLGLAAVLGIVRSHRGALFVESVIGRGSVFRLLLPASRAFSASPAGPSLPLNESNRRGRPKFEGTVLIVDDETYVREVAAMALRSTGLEVIEAQDGIEALHFCREHSELIDLVLLDLTMPGLSGEETLRRLRMQDGRMKVILMSGYSEADATQRCAELGVVAFVHKPFELDHLFEVIRPHLSVRST